MTNHQPAGNWNKNLWVFTWILWISREYLHGCMKERNICKPCIAIYCKKWSRKMGTSVFVASGGDAGACPAKEDQSPRNTCIITTTIKNISKVRPGHMGSINFKRNSKHFNTKDRWLNCNGCYVKCRILADERKARERHRPMRLNQLHTICTHFKYSRTCQSILNWKGKTELTHCGYRCSDPQWSPWRMHSTRIPALDQHKFKRSRNKLQSSTTAVVWNLMQR